MPHRLRYRLAYDHALGRAVVQAFVRGVRGFQRRQARRAGLGEGETGMVTGLQRFGGALNLHVHAHTLVIDGVFVAHTEGKVTFDPAPPLTDADVQRVLRTVRCRILRVLATRGIDLCGDVAGSLRNDGRERRAAW